MEDEIVPMPLKGTLKDLKIYSIVIHLHYRMAEESEKGWGKRKAAGRARGENGDG